MTHQPQMRMDTLLEVLHRDPADRLAWLVLADRLEELGQTERSEVLRLRLALQQAERKREVDRERRLQALLGRGVVPVAPARINSVGMRLALIPPGSFWMGSPIEEPGRLVEEGPVHRVTLTRPFYLGVYPVTQGQYRHVIGTSPSHFAPGVCAGDTSDHPVEGISWLDAIRFCQHLSNLPEEKNAGRSYRLPTEAEWEYACRAGTQSPYAAGDDEDALARTGWYRENSGGQTHPVGQKEPNAFGLHDMHGNVWEWVLDRFDEDYYPYSPETDPSGPRAGTRRALRGGGYCHAAHRCRSAYRFRYEAMTGHHDFGMRVVMTGQ